MPDGFVKFQQYSSLQVLYFLSSYISYLFLSARMLETEAATRGVLCKKVFLKVLQNSQENTCARVLGLQLC